MRKKEDDGVDYTIVVHGTGAKKGVAGEHKTAEQLLEKFLQELKDNGHVVEVATISHGETVVKEA